MVNLSSFLALQSKERLRALAARWELGTVVQHLGRQQLAVALQQRMVEQWPVADALERLSPDALRAALAIANHPGGRASAPLLTKELSLSDEAVTAALDELLDWGFLWPPAGVAARQAAADSPAIVQMPDEIARLVKTVSQARALAEGGRQPLRELISRLDDATLNRLYERWRVDGGRLYRKRELVNALLVVMLDQHALEEAVADAGPTAQRLVALLDGAPPAPIGSIAARLELPEPEVRVGLRALAGLGLVHDTYNAAATRLVYLPTDVSRALKNGTGGESLLPRLPEPPAAERPALPHMLLDLMTILNFARVNRPKLTADGRLPKRALNVLNQQLVVPLADEDESTYTRFNLTVSLAMGRDLLAQREERLVPGDDLSEWERLSFEQQSRALLGQWLHDNHWFDAGAGSVVGWIGLSRARGRQRLVAWLNRLDPDAWYPIPALLAAIKQRDPMILRSRPEVIQYLGYHGVEQLMRSWEQSDGAALVQMLAEPLHWFGVVDLGLDDAGRPAAIRLTELGKWLLGDPTTPPPPPAESGPPLVVQPNFEVLALRLDGPTLYGLSRFAELKRADRVAWFELTKASVQQAVDGGSTVDDLVALLTEQSRTGLPQNVEFTLRDWTRAYRRVYLEAVTLLEVEDATVLDAIMASARHRKRVARRLSPTLALLDPAASPDTTIAALRRDGFYAHLRGDPPKEEAPPWAPGGGRGWRRR